MFNKLTLFLKLIIIYIINTLPSQMQEMSKILIYDHPYS